MFQIIANVSNYMWKFQDTRNPNETKNIFRKLHVQFKQDKLI